MTENTPNARLRKARARFFDTATEAAEAMGVPVSTYIGHENGRRGFPAKRAPQYARKFKVAEEWLLYGKGDGPIGEPEREPEPILSVAQIEPLVATAMLEWQPGMTAGEIVPIVAEAIHVQLKLAQSGAVIRDLFGPSPARGKAPQSPAPTRKSEPVKSRSA